MKKTLKEVIRYTIILFGLLLMANGIVFLVEARLGVNPWNVLHIGISNITGISLGRAIQVVGLFLLVASYSLGIKPRIATLLNMYFIGLFVDHVTKLGYITQPDNILYRIIFCFVGIACTGLGTAIYISANCGAGPRDSLMLALSRRTGHRIGIVRAVMEVTVTVVGYFLGGPLGVGTLLFALFVGVFIEFGFFIIRKLKENPFYCRWWLSKDLKDDKCSAIKE